MKTENKVCAHIVSPTYDKQMECDVLIAFGISEIESGIGVQLAGTGEGIASSKVTSMLAHSVVEVVNSIAKDRVHAILLRRLLYSVIQDDLRPLNDDEDILKAIFEGEIK